MINYVTVDRIFSKLSRDLRGTDLNEGDLIEWIGEALEFLKVPQTLTQEVDFFDVKDYHANVPEGLHMITQIARNNEPTKDCSCNLPAIPSVGTSTTSITTGSIVAAELVTGGRVVAQFQDQTIRMDQESTSGSGSGAIVLIKIENEVGVSYEGIRTQSGGKGIGFSVGDTINVRSNINTEDTVIRVTEIGDTTTTTTATENNDSVPVNVPCGCDFTCPDRILNPDWTYEVWTSSPEYTRNYTPVRLATGTLFNSLVCKEKDESLYMTCTDEYTVVGTVDKRLRFNFIEGQIALSYLKNTVDEETGYPLIPDNISYISAITYYIKWKVAEMHSWAGRDNFVGQAQKAEQSWLKYCRQAKNSEKMPKTLDDYQNLLEQTHYLIPNHKRYYGFFGNLGKAQSRNFNRLNRING